MPVLIPAFIEGILTCLVAILFYFIIVDFPEDAKWLSSEEREYVKARLAEDVGDSLRAKVVRAKDAWKIIKDRE